MRSPHDRLRRGAALTEFALVAPTLVTMLLFSMFFTEVLRAKLKLQEASRFAAWEMTSFTLTDYGNNNGGRHDTAFNLAKTETLATANQKFTDLDSVDDGPAGNFMVGYTNVSSTMVNMPVQSFNQNFNKNGSGVGGVIVQSALNAVNGSTDWFYNRFGFNMKGKVQVEFTATLDNRILPRNFLNDGRGLFQQDQWGGSNLQGMVLKNRFTMVADGWHLPDGADADMTIDRGNGGPRAGVHNGGSPHGMYLQVARMQSLSASNAMGSIPGFNQVIGVLSFLGLPDPFASSFAVAHNYGLDTNGNTAANRFDCDQDPGHTAPDGMNNLEEDARAGNKYGSKLDYDRRKCYDTAPFRDQMTYGNSEYIQSFAVRGQYFMGCMQAMADDPSADTVAVSVTQGDRNTQKVGCKQ